MTFKSLFKRLPLHGWLGLGLILIFWTLNWSLTGLRTHWCFFPLWLGYCLTVDAFVFVRKGSSLYTRNPRAYGMLFLVSVPAWWLFEILNARAQNWFYQGREFFSDIEYSLWASLSFSTVIPAVFGTAELISTFPWIKRFKHGLRIIPTRNTMRGIFTTGGMMILLLLLWPRYFFPFLWLSVFFLLEPLNVWLGHRSLFHYTAVGEWRPVLSLWGGVLICGFFWEMWNFYSYPKWVYQIPFVEFIHIFEMPLLGYGGYLPFSLELFALYHFLQGLVQPKEAPSFIQLAPEVSS